MKALAPVLIAVLLSGCSGLKHVSPARFKQEYAWVGQAQTMRSAAYLGQGDGRAYIKAGKMSLVGSKWSDRVLYVRLSELDPAFRESLPKTEIKEKP